MFYCTHCGAENEDGVKDCAYCGKPLELPGVDLPEYTEEDEIDLGQPAAKSRRKKVSVAAASEPRAVGKREKVFAALGSVFAYLCILVCVGLFFMGGVIKSGVREDSVVSVLDYFDFSGDGIWAEVFEAFGEGGGVAVSVAYLPEFFGGVAVAATVLTFFFMFLFGTISFAGSLRGGDASGIIKMAARTFTAYLTGILILYTLYAGKDIGLNLATICGLCAGFVLLMLSLIMRFVGERAYRNSRRIAPVALSFVALAVGAVIAVLAAMPTFSVGSRSVTMFSQFCANLAFAEIGIEAKEFAFSMFGFLSALILITAGADVIRVMSIDVLYLSQSGSRRAGGLGASITMLVMAAVHLVSVFVYAGEASVSITLPVVLIVFAAVLVGLVAARKAVAKKM